MFIVTEYAALIAFLIDPPQKNKIYKLIQNKNRTNRKKNNERIILRVRHQSVISMFVMVYMRVCVRVDGGVRKFRLKVRCGDGILVCYSSSFIYLDIC